MADSGDNFDELAEKAQELYYDGDFDEAEATSLEAIRIGREAGRNDWEYASALNTYAGVLRAQGREGEALAPSKEALEILERDAEPGDSDLAGVAANVGQILLHTGNAEEAVKYFEKAVRIHEAAEEVDHAAVASIMANMASVYEEEEDGEKYVQYYRRGLEHALKGRVPAIAAELAMHLSEELCEREEFEEAADILETVRDSFVATLSAPRDLTAVIDPEAMAFEVIKEEFQKDKVEPPLLLVLRLQLARVNQVLGHEDEDIVSTLPEMSTFEGRIYGEDSFELGRQYHQVGVAIYLLAQETDRPADFQKAEQYFKRAIEIYKQHPETADAELEQARDDLADLYEDTGRNPDDARG